MADENTNSAPPVADQTASLQNITDQGGSADASNSSGTEVVVEPVEPAPSVGATVQTHAEVAFTDRAVLLFEELVRHIKSEETALVDGVNTALADLVAKVRG